MPLTPHFFPSFFTHAGGCTACSTNTYKSATGLGTCTNCGSGSNTNGVTGATSALQCVCAPGKTLESATCVNCLVNSYKVAHSNAACDACPSGTMTGGVTGASTLLGCKCPSGKKGTDPNSCALCDVGQYKSSIGFASTCDTCPSGSTTATTGSTALSACVCPAGSRGTASASCVLCDAGQYKSAFGFASSCDTCPSGSTTATTGSIASSACVCPAGSRGTNSASCALCDVGQYKSAFGFASSCDTCPSGSTTATTGSIASSACVCPAGSRGTNSASCALCDVGQYKSSIGFSSTYVVFYLFR